MDDQAEQELHRELLAEQAATRLKPELIANYVARYSRPVSAAEGAYNRAVLARAMGIADDYRPGRI